MPHECDSQNGRKSILDFATAMQPVAKVSAARPRGIVFYAQRFELLIAWLLRLMQQVGELLLSIPSR
ncbi:MAG: hypothetical protein ACREV1_12265 [Gammaproteobacteria bacterium]